MITKEQILDAAVRRFSHFGVHKTSMAEIAEDLSVSRPLLAHHFPDKPSLIAAVLRMIGDGYLQALAGASANKPLEGALLGWIGVRRQVFEKYFRLATPDNRLEVQSWHPGLLRLLRMIRLQEVRLLNRRLQEARHRGEIRPVNTTRTAFLLVEVFQALERRLGDQVVPAPADLDALFGREKEVLLLLINGLRTGCGKNAAPEPLDGAGHPDRSTYSSIEKT